MSYRSKITTGQDPLVRPIKDPDKDEYLKTTEGSNLGLEPTLFLEAISDLTGRRVTLTRSTSVSER